MDLGEQTCKERAEWSVKGGVFSGVRGEPAGTAAILRGVTEGRGGVVKS